MLVFCFILIISVTYIKTQKSVQVKLNENTDWIPIQGLTERINVSKDYEKIIQNRANISASSILLNSNGDHKKHTDLIKGMSENQAGNADLITPRFFHRRTQIDGVRKSYDSKDTLAEIKYNSFENPITNIPLIETFREKFLGKQVNEGQNDSLEKEAKNQNKFSTNANKENSSDGKLKMTEKDAIAVHYINERFHQTTQLDQSRHFSQQINNVSAKPHENFEAKETSLKNITEKQKNSLDGNLQNKNSTPIKKQTTMINLVQNVTKNSEIESKLKFEEDCNKQTTNLTKSKNLDLKPEESSVRSKNSGGATKKNDTESINQLARFRKQVLSWQNIAPMPNFSKGVTDTTPNLQLQSTVVNNTNTYGYSSLPLRSPEPLPVYYSNNQRVAGYNYSPTREPIKITQQPSPTQNFKPANPDQNSYLPDRPPTEFEIFNRQDQDTNNQYYNPGIQSYARPQPMKNNSFYNVPAINYYYPSVSYQPIRTPPQNEQTAELTTQGYPPLEVPSQTYQVPAYQYGVPEQSQVYGPPSPEFSQIQEQKPYFPQSYSKITLSDDQCVMNREVIAEALVEVVLSLGNQRSQLRNCALMFTSSFNIAVSSMIQSDQNSTTIDLVRQLNLKMFSVQPTGHILEIKFPWYLDDKSPGLSLGDSGNIIITFQPSTSIAFRLLIFSYRDVTPRIPIIFSYLLTANATMPLNETEPMELPTPQEKSDENVSTEQENPVLIKVPQPQLLEISVPNNK